ncbi:MAG: protein translocase subunit SecF, partial [Alphaproteobacteria bacterium]
MRLLRLVPPNTKIDFIRPHKLFFAISALLVLGSVLSYAVQGLNYGIDFKGGVLIEVKSQGPANLSAMRAALS